MTTTTIYRLHCDAPQCEATDLTEKLGQVPDGWIRLSSTAHLDGWKSGGSYRAVTGRMRRDPRSSWEVWAGAFALHLCPAHRDTFAEHQPQTEGLARSSRGGDQQIRVTCSCGAFRDSTTAATLVLGSDDTRPVYLPERSWWSHLPTELREYAVRAHTRRRVA